MTSKIWLRVTIFTAAAGLLVSPGFGQSKGGGTTGTGSTGTTGSTGSTGTTGTPTTGRPTSTTTQPTQQQTPTVQLPQPIFISGRVMMEDGGAPPEPLTIQTVCNGVAHSEGYTDAKGYFGLELGSNHGVIADASEISSMRSTLGGASGTDSSGSSLTTGGFADSPDRKYMGCDLQAKLSGYRSQTVPLAGRRPMDDPNIGTILMHRMGKAEEGRTVSAVSLGAPKDAKKAYEKGLDALKKKKYEDAQKSFEKALELYPKYATAWFELGRLRPAEQKFDLARASFDEALKADPKYVQPYLQISLLDMAAKRWQALADITDQTVKLDPFDYPQAFFFNSVANFNLRNMEAAEKSALEAERLDTRHQFPKVSHLLGLILVDRKDYGGATVKFKDYLRLAPQASDAATVQSQLAILEKAAAQMAEAGKQ